MSLGLKYWRAAGAQSGDVTRASVRRYCQCLALRYSQYLIPRCFPRSNQRCFRRSQRLMSKRRIVRTAAQRLNRKRRILNSPSERTFAGVWSAERVVTLSSLFHFRWPCFVVSLFPCQDLCHTGTSVFPYRKYDVRLFTAVLEAADYKAIYR